MSILMSMAMSMATVLSQNVGGGDSACTNSSDGWTGGRGVGDKEISSSGRRAAAIIIILYYVHQCTNIGRDIEIDAGGRMAGPAPPHIVAWAVDRQKKGKKKASDERHDAQNPDVFNGPPGQS